MPLSQIRKALVAFATAFLSAYAVAYANVGWSWDAAGGCAIFATLSALAVWAVPNADRPIPESAAHLTPVARMAQRSAARGKP